eukprot:CAMPEP_0202904692 /NCGR_PEP_ID=MMETSP1392-20130828/30676_1 /ASSEMBLY_ACC=CAM_ASM_000868 /TAXON_ID=225041 /ORGANISM="Chlamydomonas chlamydogama, Strain SAG 11-48b" /LENGTH=78 /DNA_ID=CAMNT_0049592463 /DNA_START=90 /DNA_END=323 /DNA_ORIENTATION=-
MDGVKAEEVPGGCTAMWLAQKQARGHSGQARLGHTPAQGIWGGSGGYQQLVHRAHRGAGFLPHARRLEEVIVVTMHVW